MGNPLGLVPAEPFFGTDIQSQLEEWWWGGGEEKFFRLHPDEKGKKYFALILDPNYAHDAQRPFAGPSYCLTNLRGADLLNPVGTPSNVAGKLRFVLRTGLDSVEAETRHDLGLPGDFTWEGGGKTHGYPGGVSGFVKEVDTALRVEITEKIVELRTVAADPIFQAAKERSAATKYLGGHPLGLAGGRMTDDAWP